MKISWLKIKRKRSALAAILVILIAAAFIVFRVLGAEQSGSSPTSSTDSRIKTAYDWLVAKGTNYGQTDAGDWSDNWETYWNRITEAAAWEPEGTATEADVTTGLTFYSGLNNRSIKTGTLYSSQSLMNWDDYEAGDETGEESTWTNTLQVMLQPVSGKTEEQAFTGVLTRAVTLMSFLTKLTPPVIFSPLLPGEIMPEVIVIAVMPSIPAEHLV